MRNNKNDCSAGIVKLDLNELIKVVGRAVYDSKGIMEDHKLTIENNISAACRLPDGDHDKYVHLCHANTETEWFLDAAKQYADAVSMYFYLEQAKVREEIVVVRENKNEKE